MTTIKGANNLIQFPNLMENYIIKICNRKFIEIEFENEYEPEIKLKLLYEFFKNYSSEEISAINIRNAHDFFIESLLGILKRFDVNNANFDTFYHILLTLELIKPNDSNNVIRSIILERKLFNLVSSNYKINLHLKLISIYIDNITDSESINFIRKFLLNDFHTNKYCEHPVFITIFLRSFIRFGSDADFLSIMEILLSTKTTKLELFQLNISIHEFLKTKMSYEAFYLWLIKVIRQDTNYNQSILNFIKEHIFSLISKLAEKNNNGILYLMLSEICLLELEDKFDIVIKSLQKFNECVSSAINNDINLAKYFSEYVLYLEYKGYTTSINNKYESNTIHIYKPEYVIFESLSEPYIVKLENDLYISFLNLKYPRILADVGFSKN